MLLMNRTRSGRSISTERKWLVICLVPLKLWGFQAGPWGRRVGLVVHYVRFHLISLFSVKHLPSDLMRAWRLSTSFTPKLSFASPQAFRVPGASSSWAFLESCSTLLLTVPRSSLALSRKRKLKLKLVIIYLFTLQFIKLLLIFFILFCAIFIPLLSFSKVSEGNRDECAC